MSQNVQNLPLCEEMTVSYTGTTADIAVGYLVCATGANETDGTPIVVRPATAHLTKAKFVVTDVSPVVNQISTGTTRKGGLIKVIPVKTAVGNFEIYCAASQSAGDYVGVADGVFAATTISDSSNDTIAEQARYIGQQIDATTAAAVVTVHVGGF